MINATAISSCCCICLTYWTLPSGNVALFAINLALIGFSVIPIIPISYSFAVELTFPTPEAMSNGMMILPSQIYGASLGVVAGIICDLPEDKKMGPMYATTLFLASCIIGAIASLFIKEELRRLKPKEGPKELSYDANGQLLDTESSLANAF